jgi:hypothetical protein
MIIKVRSESQDSKRGGAKSFSLWVVDTLFLRSEAEQNGCKYPSPGTTNGYSSISTIQQPHYVKLAEIA